MKVYLDYIPFVSWVNTYRRTKAAFNPTNEKIKHLWQLPEAKSSKSAKILRIVGTGIPFFGNGVLGITDIFRKISSKQKTNAETTPNQEVYLKIIKSFPRDAEIDKKFLIYKEQILQDPFLQANPEIASAVLDCLTECYILKLFYERYPDDAGEFHRRMLRPIDRWIWCRDGQEITMHNASRTFLESLEPWVNVHGAAKLFYFLSQNKNPIMQLTNTTTKKPIITPKNIEAAWLKAQVIDEDGEGKDGQFSTTPKDSVREQKDEDFDADGDGKLSTTPKASVRKQEDEDIDADGDGKLSTTPKASVRQEEEVLNNDGDDQLSATPKVSVRTQEEDSDTDVDDESTRADDKARAIAALHQKSNAISFEGIDQALTDLEEYKTDKFFDYYDRQARIFNLLTTKMISREIWDDEQFAGAISRFMKCAYSGLELYFEEIGNLVDHDPKRIAKEMSTQPQEPKDSIGKGSYCHPYFNASLTDMYHLARNYQFVVPHPTGCIDDYGNFVYGWHDNPSKKDFPIFFKKGSPECEWRDTFNKGCALLNKKLRTEFKKKGGDNRFITWSTPDTKKAFFFSDTKPT